MQGQARSKKKNTNTGRQFTGEQERKPLDVPKKLMKFGEQ